MRWINKRNDIHHPPCKVEMKLTLSLCSNLVSSLSLSYQSASLIKTRIPGRLSRVKITFGRWWRTFLVYGLRVCLQGVWWLCWLWILRGVRVLVMSCRRKRDRDRLQNQQSLSNCSAYIIYRICKLFFDY